MTVRGIGGVFFKARDPEALAAWYEKHLGVHRDEEGYSVFGWRELDRPARVGGTVWAPFPHETEYFDPGGADWMVNYRVDDLDATLQSLRAAGVEIVGEPESFEYGRFGWILDLEGNKVELWEPPHEAAFEATVPRTSVEPGLEGEWLCEPGAAVAARDGASSEALVKERLVALGRDEVWRLWTTGEGMAEWLVEHNQIELRLGGPYELYFSPDAPAGERGGEGCRVLSFLPKRMLAFTWNAPPHLAYTRSRYTHVVVELADEGEGTMVRLTHLGWPDPNVDDHPQWEETREYFDSAWESVLDALEQHAEEGG